MSEKNLAEPMAVELTETLHDTAAILSRQPTCSRPPFFLHFFPQQKIFFYLGEQYFVLKLAISRAFRTSEILSQTARTSLQNLGMDQRLFNNIDTKAFVWLPLKQDSRRVQRHSLCLSADPLASVVFLGWCYLCIDKKNFSNRIKYRIWVLLNVKCSFWDR